MYKNMKSAVITNGHTSKYFSISRGIRQGDSLSALLYVLQAEPLAQYLRSTDEFEGITIKTCKGENKKTKIGQFVDDMEIFIKNVSQTSTCMKIVDEFGLASGSKVNRKKTIGLVANSKNSTLDIGVRLSLGPEITLGVPAGKYLEKTGIGKVVLTS
jgi:hypothetical protein